MQDDAFSIIPDAVTHLAVACSGGADSLCLALELAEWCRARTISMTALHVNHAIRPTAGEEAVRVQAWLRAEGIACNILTVQEDLRSNGNLQAVARQARYALMIEWCNAHNVMHLCLAHHADDQAETFFMRLARGSGVDGLSAMKPVSVRAGVTLLRPYLHKTKVELQAYVQARGLPWIDDPSNANSAFTRVVMRNLLPELQHAGISSRHIVNATAHLARAADCLQHMTQAWLLEHHVLQHGYYATLPPEAFAALHEELKFRVLSECLQHFNKKELRFVHLNALLQAMQQAGFKKATLHGCIIHLYHGDVLIYPEMQHIAPPQVLMKGAYWGDYVRFCMTPAIPLMCGALGAKGLAVLKAQRWRLPSLPATLLHTLPAIWHLDVLYAVPHIDYYTQPCKDEVLRIIHDTDEP
jgi:tRNA(Ile)-lysidine synthase